MIDTRRQSTCHSPFQFVERSSSRISVTPLECVEATCQNPFKEVGLYDVEGVSVQEDETSVSITIEMPGVRGSDISVQVHTNSLAVGGVRKLRHSNKKQRISRRLPLDSTLVDVQRAVANMFNGVLVLYAPKKHKFVQEEVDASFEFFSPAADILRAKETPMQPMSSF